MGNHVFFGGRDSSPLSSPEIRTAKAMCAQCPVRRQCLETGLNEEWGMWGGYTKPERMRALLALENDPETVLRALDTGELDDVVRCV